MKWSESSVIVKSLSSWAKDESWSHSERSRSQTLHPARLELYTRTDRKKVLGKNKS